MFQSCIKLFQSVLSFPPFRNFLVNAFKVLPQLGRHCVKRIPQYIVLGFRLQIVVQITIRNGGSSVGNPVQIGFHVMEGIPQHIMVGQKLGKGVFQTVEERGV